MERLDPMVPNYLETVSGAKELGVATPTLGDGQRR